MGPGSLARSQFICRMSPHNHEYVFSSCGQIFNTTPPCYSGPQRLHEFNLHERNLQVAWLRNTLTSVSRT